MTIPLTNVNMQHINAAMNRIPTAHVDYYMQGNRTMRVSTETVTKASIADMRVRVKNNGYVTLIKARPLNRVDENRNVILRRESGEARV